MTDFTVWLKHIYYSYTGISMSHRHQNNWRFTMKWEAGWRYGIISTDPCEQQKIIRQIILFQKIYYLSISLTGHPCHREQSIVLMFMNEHTLAKQKARVIKHGSPFLEREWLVITPSANIFQARQNNATQVIFWWEWEY